MESDFTEFVVSTFLCKYARLAEASEAIAFRVERTGLPQPSLELMIHIRPDDSDEPTRRRAAEAFRDVAQTCVNNGKPGGVKAGEPMPGEAAHYCMIIPFPPTREARLVFGLAVRAANDEAATQKLNALLR